MIWELIGGTKKSAYTVPLCMALRFLNYKLRNRNTRLFPVTLALYLF